MGCWFVNVDDCYCNCFMCSIIVDIWNSVGKVVCCIFFIFKGFELFVWVVCLIFVFIDGEVCFWVEGEDFIVVEYCVVDCC